MRRRITPIRTIVVRPAQPRNPVMLAVVQRLAAFAGRGRAADLRARAPSRHGPRSARTRNRRVVTTNDSVVHVAQWQSCGL